MGQRLTRTHTRIHIRNPSIRVRRTNETALFYDLSVSSNLCYATESPDDFRWRTDLAVLTITWLVILQLQNGNNPTQKRNTFFFM